MLKKWFASRKFRNQQEDEEDVDGEGGNKENDEKKLHRLGASVVSRERNKSYKFFYLS